MHRFRLLNSISESEKFSMFIWSSEGFPQIWALVIHKLSTLKGVKYAFYPHV
jgi:hypothetical protein